MRFAFLVLILCLLTGCSGTTLIFEIDDGNELDGQVYVDGKYIGITENGVLSLEEDVIGSKLNFVGIYFGREFNQSYNLPEDLSGSLVFTSTKQSLESFTFYSSQDGALFLNNLALGNIRDGKLIVPLENLFAGTLYFKGMRDGEEFEVEYLFDRSKLSSYNLELTIDEEHVDNLLFDASTMDVEAAAAALLVEVNRERAKEGLDTWSLNRDVALVAQQYSLKQVDDGFAHTDAQGRGVKERLDDANIFYLIAGENLYFVDGLGTNSDENSIARGAVDGWLKSPGHRALLLERDDLYTDVGFGVHCIEKRCYVTMNVIGASVQRSLDLGANTCSLITVFDRTHPFKGTVIADFNIESSRDVHVWLADDDSAIDDCVDRSSINGEYFGEDDSFFETEVLKKGNVLLFQADQSVDVQVRIDYK